MSKNLIILAVSGAVAISIGIGVYVGVSVESKPPVVNFTPPTDSDNLAARKAAVVKKEIETGVKLDTSLFPN